MIPVMAENVVYVPSANGSKKKTPLLWLRIE